jgi:hypothetical protein
VCSLWQMFEWGDDLTVSERAHWEALFDGTLSAADLDGLKSTNDLGPIEAKLDKAAREAEDRASKGLLNKWFTDDFNVILEYPEPRSPGLVPSPLFHFVRKVGVDPNSNEARLVKVATSLGPSSLAFTKPKVRPGRPIPPCVCLVDPQSVFDPYASVPVQMLLCRIRKSFCLGSFG